MEIVGNSFVNCIPIYVIHDKKDIDTLELFLAHFIKRFAGGNSYPSELLDIIKLNLKTYLID